MRRTLTAVAAVSVTLALTAGTEGAMALSKANVKVEVTSAKQLKNGGVKVRGKITSSKKACKKTRPVKVFHDVAPRGPGPEDFFLGQTVGDEDGDWQLTTEFLPDKVYASVVGKRKCKGDVSKTEPVED